jgi:hypothetical protein
MKTAKLNRTIRFKFGKALRKGLLVEIAQTNENTCLVRRASEPTLEYLISKDALDIVQPEFKIDGRKTKKLAKVLDAALYKSPLMESDVLFKDEGDMTTICFVSDKAQIALKSDPVYSQVKDRVYGVNVLKIDILNESVRNMVAWAISHSLTVNFN